MVVLFFVVATAGSHENKYPPLLIFCAPLF